MKPNKINLKEFLKFVKHAGKDIEFDMEKGTFKVVSEA